MEKFYFEHTIKLEPQGKSYLKLLDLYFRPDEFFKSVENECKEKDLFDKIFPYRKGKL